MSYRPSFTSSDWDTLMFAPLWTFTAIAASDKDIDKKEIEALAKEIQDAPLYKEALVREVLMSIAVDFSNVWGAYQRDSRDVMTGLRETAEVLGRNVPADEANGFKKAMLLIGSNIANATGGSLFKKDKVSEEEKKALVMIALMLNVNL